MDKEQATEIKAIVDAVLEEFLPDVQSRIVEVGRKCSVFVGCPRYDCEYVGLFDHFGKLFEKFSDLRMEWRPTEEEIVISTISFEDVKASGAGQGFPDPKEVQVYPRKNGGKRNALRFRKASIGDNLSQWVILIPCGMNIESNIESLVHDSLVSISHVVRVSAVKAKTISDLSEGREVLMLIFETLQMSLLDSILDPNTYAC